MRSRLGPSPEFDRLRAGEPDISLARVALEIAKDHNPHLDIEHYLDRIDKLAERVLDRRRPDASVREVLLQINWILYVEEELRGNTAEYYDPRNSFLNEVLDRKLGIPISLAVIYREIGRRVGLDLEGVNLPHHFMLRVEDEGEILFVDAFHAGSLLDEERCRERLTQLTEKPISLAPHLCEPCPPRTLISRMLRNLKIIHHAEQDLPSLLPIQRRLAALTPDAPDELRDLAITCVKLGKLGEAADAFHDAIMHTHSPDQRRELETARSLVLKELARLN